MLRCTVAFGVDGDALDAGFGAGFYAADCDFAAVCDEHFFDVVEFVCHVHVYFALWI